MADKTTAGNELSRMYYYPTEKAIPPIQVELPSTIRKGPGGSHIVLTCKGKTLHVPGGFNRVVPVYRDGLADTANEDTAV